MNIRYCVRKYIWGILLAGAVALGVRDFGQTSSGNRVEASDVRTLTERYSDSMEEEDGDWIDQAGQALNGLALDRHIMGLVYLSDRYPIRLKPFYGSRTAVTVYSGQMVDILDVYVDDEFTVWMYVTLSYGEKEYYGYIPRANLAVSDSRFLKWEEDYGMNFAAVLYSSVSGGDGGAANLDIELFPKSYRPALYALREKHPEWKFVKLQTGLDWNSAVDNEMKNSRSLVWHEFPEWAKDELYDSHNWYYATRPVLEMYMDPRNGLSEEAIFQFELLTFNEEFHTKSALEGFLDNTFMKGDKPAPGLDAMTYADIFWALTVEKKDGDGSRERDVSPFHLAARVLQEQGVKGDSPLISGTYPGFEGYYNYFNISAAGTTDEQVCVSGLTYAKNAGWTNAYFAIMGGTDFIIGNYITKGQETLYLQKFNVKPGAYYAPYTHQYMQNISAPTTEARSIRNLYRSVDEELDIPFVFSIPVYENMPGQPCGEPEDSLTIRMQVPEGYSRPVIYLDGVACDARIADGYYELEAPDKEVKTAIAYQYNESGVPVGMYVWSLTYRGKRYLVTPEHGLKDLLTAHGFSVRITGKTGIRFKSGISVDQRAALTGEGVDGYRLKEYGTILMDYADYARHPLVRGGAGVGKARAYGSRSDGTIEDLVFEETGGRYLYTAVLVGLPVKEYKTRFAFRAYAVLEKDGKNVTLYGPIAAQSIYNLAKTALKSGTYAPGTEAQVFLQKLTEDADAYETTVSSGDAR